MLNIVTPHIPLLPSQHGFRPNHSTNTLLTQMTQNMLEGFNHKRTLFITIDISKVFDATPRHELINKIYNTNMHNNSKRWLANYLSDRKAPFYPQHCSTLFSTTSQHPPLKTSKSYPMQTTSLSHPHMLNTTQLPQTPNIT